VLHCPATRVLNLILALSSHLLSSHS
jgi:hypothetical protein